MGFDRNMTDSKLSLSRVAIAGFLLATISVLVAVASGLGYRWQWWDFGDGFMLLRWAAIAGLVAAAVSIVGCFLARPYGPRRGFTWAVIGVLSGLSVAWVPWNGLQAARSVPPIHDITTDLVNPPEFIEILPLRRDAPNSAQYGGAIISAQQLAAYPDLNALTLDSASGEAFNIALDAAHGMGWEVIASDPASGRIEATATTLWFGFKDDVVVRITDNIDGGSRIDVRSVSRVGTSDVGANEKRITLYFEKIKNR